MILGRPAVRLPVVGYSISMWLNQSNANSSMVVGQAGGDGPDIFATSSGVGTNRICDTSDSATAVIGSPCVGNRSCIVETSRSRVRLRARATQGRRDLRHSIIRRSGGVTIAFLVGHAFNYALFWGADRILNSGRFGLFYTAVLTTNIVMSPMMAVTLVMARRFAEVGAIAGRDRVVAMTWHMLGAMHAGRAVCHRRGGASGRGNSVARHRGVAGCSAHSHHGPSAGRRRDYAHLPTEHAAVRSRECALDRQHRKPIRVFLGGSLPFSLKCGPALPVSSSGPLWPQPPSCRGSRVPHVKGRPYRRNPYRCR